MRLRLLNGSNARVYEFGFSDDRAFALVGTDGGLLARAHQTRRVMLSPGERAEIVVTLRPGERTVLRSTPPDLGSGGFEGRFAGGDDRLDVLELRAADHLQPSAPVPHVLTDVPRLDERDAVRTRTFELRGHRINGREMDMDRIDQTVQAGSTEIWKVTNTSGTPHSLHVHDVRFQVLDVDGAPPSPALSGWQDTVYLPPHQTFRLIIPFGGYADPDTPYMFHCHLLRHEDQGMMGQFLVTG